jgi:hypothetical protein
MFKKKILSISSPLVLRPKGSTRLPAGSPPMGLFTPSELDGRHQFRLEGSHLQQLGLGSPGLEAVAETQDEFGTPDLSNVGSSARRGSLSPETSEERLTRLVTALLGERISAAKGFLVLPLGGFTLYCMNSKDVGDAERPGGLPMGPMLPRPMLPGGTRFSRRSAASSMSRKIAIRSQGIDMLLKRLLEETRRQESVLAEVGTASDLGHKVALLERELAAAHEGRVEIQTELSELKQQNADLVEYMEEVNANSSEFVGRIRIVLDLSQQNLMNLSRQYQMLCKALGQVVMAEFMPDSISAKIDDMNSRITNAAQRLFLSGSVEKFADEYRSNGSNITSDVDSFSEKLRVFCEDICSVLEIESLAEVQDNSSLAMLMGVCSDVERLLTIKPEAEKERADGEAEDEDVFGFSRDPFSELAGNVQMNLEEFFKNFEDCSNFQLTLTGITQIKEISELEDSFSKELAAMQEKIFGRFTGKIKQDYDAAWELLMSSAVAYNALMTGAGLEAAEMFSEQGLTAALTPEFDSIPVYAIALNARGMYFEFEREYQRLFSDAKDDESWAEGIRVALNKFLHDGGFELEDTTYDWMEQVRHIFSVLEDPSSADISGEVAALLDHFHGLSSVDLLMKVEKFLNKLIKLHTDVSNVMAACVAVRDKTYTVEEAVEYAEEQLVVLRKEKEAKLGELSIREQELLVGEAHLVSVEEEYTQRVEALRSDTTRALAVMRSPVLMPAYSPSLREVAKALTFTPGGGFSPAAGRVDSPSDPMMRIEREGDAHKEKVLDLKQRQFKTADEIEKLEEEVWRIEYHIKLQEESVRFAKAWQVKEREKEAQVARAALAETREVLEDTTRVAELEFQIRGFEASLRERDLQMQEYVEAAARAKEQLQQKQRNIDSLGQQLSDARAEVEALKKQQAEGASVEAPARSIGDAEARVTDLASRLDIELSQKAELREQMSVLISRNEELVRDREISQMMAEDRRVRVQRLEAHTIERELRKRREQEEELAGMRAQLAAMQVEKEEALARARQLEEEARVPRAPQVFFGAVLGGAMPGVVAADKRAVGQSVASLHSRMLAALDTSHGSTAAPLLPAVLSPAYSHVPSGLRPVVGTGRRALFQGTFGGTPLGMGLGSALMTPGAVRGPVRGLGLPLGSAMRFPPSAGRGSKVGGLKPPSFFLPEHRNVKGETFREVRAADDGDCGFHVLGITREAAVAQLLGAAEDENIRRIVAPEIRASLFEGSIPAQMRSLPGFDAFYAQIHTAAFDTLVREANDLWRQQNPSETDSFSYDTFEALHRMGTFTETLELNAKVEGMLALVGAQNEAIRGYCEDINTFRAFISSYYGRPMGSRLGGGWLSYQRGDLTTALDALARLNNIQVFVYQPDTVVPGQLQLVHSYDQPDPARTVYMLHKRLSHFNRLEKK